MAKSFVYSELGVPEPKPWEEIFGGNKSEQQGDENPNDADDNESNDFKNASYKSDLQKIYAAQEKQYDALISRLRVLEQMPTEEDFQNAARQLEADFPQIAGQILARNDIAEVMASAIIDKFEAREEFQNTIDKNGMRHDERGRFSGYAGGGVNLSQGNADKDYLDSLQERVRNVKDHLKSFNELPDFNTYDYDTKNPVSFDSGFQCTFFRDEAMEQLSNAEFDKLVHDMARSQQSRVYIGRFGSAEPSVRFKTREDALKFAQKYNQHSIFDWKNKEIVRNDLYKANKILNYKEIK